MQKNDPVLIAEPSEMEDRNDFDWSIHNEGAESEDEMTEPINQANGYGDLAE